MIQAEVMTDHRPQCRECDRPSKTRGLCMTHYTYLRVANMEPKLCGLCGSMYRATGKICNPCYLRQRLQRLKQTPKPVATESAGWPDSSDLWTALRRCRTGENLREFLATRGKTAQMPQEVWPETDHSLACWIATHTDTDHTCTCGAVLKGAK